MIERHYHCHCNVSDNWSNQTWLTDNSVMKVSLYLTRVHCKPTSQPSLCCMYTDSSTVRFPGHLCLVWCWRWMPYTIIWEWVESNLSLLPEWIPLITKHLHDVQNYSFRSFFVEHSYISTLLTNNYHKHFSVAWRWYNYVSIMQNLYFLVNFRIFGVANTIMNCQCFYIKTAVG